MINTGHLMIQWQWALHDFLTDGFSPLPKKPFNVGTRRWENPTKFPTQGLETDSRSPVRLPATSGHGQNRSLPLSLPQPPRGPTLLFVPKRQARIQEWYNMMNPCTHKPLEQDTVT